jgi:RNA polymerase sigma factor (sigma-70 family)
MRAHGDAVWTRCIRVLREKGLAEDVHQQVFIEAYRDLERFSGQSSLRTWLLAIAGHRCLDAIKARRRRESRFELGSDEPDVADRAVASPDPEERLDQVKRVQALEDCLAALAAEVRMTVLMRFQSEMSYEVLSDLVKEKPATLQARVARALPVLRRCLEGKGLSP